MWAKNCLKDEFSKYLLVELCCPSTLVASCCVGPTQRPGGVIARFAVDGADVGASFCRPMGVLIILGSSRHRAG